ncbi:hypothetical protein BH23GEM9_BH23GEM9_14540 [soil metagenome]
MIPRPVRSITAAVLVALLGILHSGIPSHSHAADRPEATQGGVAISADSHSHGVILLDTAERVPATSAQVPAAAVRIEATSAAAPDRAANNFDAAPLRPSERGPPPAAPRAPPQQI